MTHHTMSGFSTTVTFCSIFKGDARPNNELVYLIVFVWDGSLMVPKHMWNVSLILFIFKDFKNLFFLLCFICDALNI